jgi:hypothetical protein
VSKIAIDIDSTLYDFEVPMRQAYLDLALEKDDKEEYFKGGYQSWVEWRSPADVCGFRAFSEALARVHSPEVILTREPFDHAVEVVNEIADEYDILYISNRAGDTAEATATWLEMAGFPDGELVCTMEDKMQHVGTIQYLIDDRPKTLVEFVYNWNWKYLHGTSNGDMQRKAFGLLFEYNRALSDIPNVYLAPTWAGLRYYLQEKGVLNGRRAATAS